MLPFDYTSHLHVWEMDPGKGQQMRIFFIGSIRFEIF